MTNLKPPCQPELAEGCLKSEKDRFRQAQPDRKHAFDAASFFYHGYLYHMKAITGVVFIVSAIFLTASAPPANEEIELTCVKKQMATQTCHYNFTINGIKYRFIDNGCKGKKDDILKKAREGKLALAKDWKIECEPKKLTIKNPSLFFAQTRVSI